MSDRMDIQNVLAQMRSVQMQSQNAISPASLDRADPGGSRVGDVQDTKSFSELMGSAINTVNDLQMQSGKLSNAVEQGVEGVTLTEAMIASQKASVAFQAVTEARNKLVSAYEKIMNMPI